MTFTHREQVHGQQRMRNGRFPPERPSKGLTPTIGVERRLLPLGQGEGGLHDAALVLSGAGGRSGRARVLRGRIERERHGWVGREAPEVGRAQALKVLRSRRRFIAPAEDARTIERKALECDHAHRSQSSARRWQFERRAPKGF